MKKVTNHKGWLTAILSIIPFFIFVSFFQGFGVGLSNVLGKRGIIDFDFDKYLEIEERMTKFEEAIDELVKEFGKDK